MSVCVLGGRKLVRVCVCGGEGGYAVCMPMSACVETLMFALRSEQKSACEGVL